MKGKRKLAARCAVGTLAVLLFCIAVTEVGSSTSSPPSPSLVKGKPRARSHVPVRVAADNDDWIMEEAVFHNRHRDRILYRSHRQAEDSYEDGGEYEYEEEHDGEGGADKNQNREEGEGEEYYDNYEEGGGNEAERGGEDGGDSGGGSSRREEEEDEEEAEEERRPPPTTTTTTTTTEQPYVEEAEEEDMDSEQYEDERYELERQRYEQAANAGHYYTEEPPPPPPPPPSTEETHTENEADIEEEETSTTPQPESRRDSYEDTTVTEDGQEERREQDTGELEEDVPSQPIHPVREDEEIETEETNQEQQERERSQEIEESGREDLERYSQQGGETGSQETLEESEPEEATRVPPAASIEQDREEEREFSNEEKAEQELPESKVESVETNAPPQTSHVEEHEVEEELEEVDEYEEFSTHNEPTSPTTTTTTTTTARPTTPKTDDRDRYQVNQRGHDPDPYDEDEEEEDEEEEEDSYYGRRPAPIQTTTTSTTVAPERVPNRSDSVEEEKEEDGNSIHGLYSLEEQNRHRYQYEHSTERPSSAPSGTTTEQYDPTNESSAENEVDSGAHETENEIIRGYTTTTTAAPSEERVQTPFHVEMIDTADSSENRIFDAKSEEIDEERINRFDLDRGSQTEEEPVAPPSESVEEEERRRVDQENPPRIECFEGYALSADGTECLDIDECAQGGSCGPTQICMNTPGSYVCSCPSGFEQDFRNARNCRDLNECEEANAGCSQDCVNTLGSFYCTCADDFQLDTDEKTCKLKPTTTTTTTTSTTTTTTTTTPAPTTTELPTPPAVAPRRPIVTDDGAKIRSCPTPPVPRGAGIAYLYCSRSPVGIHHRHSQLERRLLQDWAARKNRTQLGGVVGRHPNKFRHRRNLRRKLRQTTYAPGSMCELRCRPGFELRGQYTLQCNSTIGAWIGPRDGYCTPIPRSTSTGDAVLNITETVLPSNEIPRLAPTSNNNNLNNEFDSGLSGGETSGSGSSNQFRPSFVPATSGSRFPTFRPHQPPPPPPPNTTPRPIIVTEATTTLPPTTSTTTTSTTATPVRTAPPLLITPPPPAFYPGSGGAPTPNRRPYYGYNNYYYTPSTTTLSSITSTVPTTTTSRNSYIHLTYRFKQPWIKCPDDMKVDLGPNQSQAYVIIPQPQTNVDWWRQVTSEPPWAKGLETEIGPGKTRITFKARTSAPSNSTAECSFFLEVVDSEAPRVKECPESFTTRLAQGQSSKSVPWIEPQFTDNVRIVTVKKSHEPGAVLPMGEHFVNYEAKDSSDNRAKCSFTVTVLPPAPSYGRKPVNTDPGPTVTQAAPGTTLSTPPVHASLRNVVCHVGKKGRRIVFLSRVVPRGCSEMTVDVAADSGPGGVNTINTVTQGSAENSATSQISSVSFSSHDHPQSAGAFGQAISNGRNNNRLVHSSSSVTSGQQGTTSRASSYAVAISASSRNFDLPFINPSSIGSSGSTAQDKQIYDEEFVVPSELPQTKSRTQAAPSSISRRLHGATSEDHHYPRPAPSLVITSPSTSSTVSTPTYIAPRTAAPTLVVGNIGHQNNYSPRHHSNNVNQNYPQNPYYTNGPNLTAEESANRTGDYRKYFRHFDSWDSSKGGWNF